MSTAEALMQAILDDPDDDAPRLVYADWLEERGETERSEFIRVQVERSKLPHYKRRVWLAEREKELLAKNEEEWTGPIRDRITSWAFQRGFVAEVAVTVDAYMKHTFQLVHLAPIRRMRVDREDGWTGHVEVFPSAIRLIPEGIARENLVLPLGHARFPDASHDLLVVAVAALNPFDVMSRLEATLNLPGIAAVEADAGQLEAAINRRYVQSRM